VSSSSKLPPGTEPPLVTSRNPMKARTAKVITAIEGDDEFSVASVDPGLRKRSVELTPADVPSKPESTGDERTLWRLFRKIFT
jgi:hypothetical protein